MNPIKLTDQTGKSSISVILCGKCGFSHLSEGLAALCCTCVICGCEITGRTRLETYCSTKCWLEQVRKDQAERFARAQKLRPDAEYEGAVYHEASDRFESSISDMLDRLHGTSAMQEEIHLYPCTEKRFAQIDLQDIVEGFEYPDEWEGELEGFEALETAVHKFNEANARLVSYEPDFTRVIVIEPSDIEVAVRPIVERSES